MKLRGRWVGTYAAAALVVILSATAAPAQTVGGAGLGPPPGPLARPDGLAPGGTAELAFGQPWIDTTNRAAVENHYRAVFNVAEPPHGWDGNVGSCQPGTLAAPYRQAILDRVNWYRGMAGVRDTVVEHGPFTGDAQASALITSANDALSHDPPTGWACWTASGHNGAARSNLAWQYTGVDAVDRFIEDDGTGNETVAHRAWFLEPTQVRMGAGAIPTGPVVSESVYVVDPDHLFDAAPIRDPDGFVSWPPPGFAPASTVYPRWSLHNYDADFTGASVSVTVNGSPVAASVLFRDGDTELRPAPRITFVPSLPGPPPAGGTAVAVTVSGITGNGVPSSHSWTTTVIPTPTGPPVRSVADFDGDGATERSVFRPSQGAWYAEGEDAVFFGLPDDIPVPCDYDGDGDTDLAVFRPSVGGWYVQEAPPVFFGLPGDVPVPGDYDGDGDCDTAVFRPSVGGWYRPGVAPTFFGLSGDVPVPGDYDGDGDADVTVFRPGVGGWYRQGASATFFGLATDVPVPGDYDGDGDADVAVFRPSVGGWYVQGQSAQFLGLNTDVPVPGDYDGDGTTERAVFRPSSGQWFVEGASTQFLGIAGDRPLPLPAAILDAIP